MSKKACTDTLFDLICADHSHAASQSLHVRLKVNVNVNIGQHCGLHGGTRVRLFRALTASQHYVQSLHAQHSIRDTKWFSIL